MIKEVSEGDYDVYKKDFIHVMIFLSYFQT